MYSIWKMLLFFFQSERARQELEQELDDLNDRLDEAGGATAAQVL